MMKDNLIAGTNGQQEPEIHKLDSPSPTRLLQEFGLVKPGKEQFIVRELNKRPFSWINLATLDLKIGQVTDTLHGSSALNPPRTAHLGGVWHNIARGGGAELALNNVVTQEGFGHPLIFDVNQTPSVTTEGNRVVQRGDTLYWPGTIFNGHAQDLPLLTWEDKNFIERDRRQSYFVPFVMTKEGDELLPLTYVHRQDMKNIENYPFRFLSDILVQNEPFVRKIFTNLLTRAVLDDEVNVNNKYLALIADRIVRQDGVVMDAPIRSTVNKKFRIGDQEYNSAEELADLMMLPYRIASNPELLYQMKDYPKFVPLLTKEMVATLMAVLETHLNPNTSSMQPINSHLHWGAFLMAGAPPKHSGYFSGNAAAIGTLLTLMRVDNPDINPIYYVLIPAAPFVLWPSKTHQPDIDAMNELVARVHLRTDDFCGKPGLIQSGVSDVVSDWAVRDGQKLSPYMISRFSPLDSTRTHHLPESGELVKPQGFDALTFRQASMLVGELKEQIR